MRPGKAKLLLSRARQRLGRSLATPREAKLHNSRGRGIRHQTRTGTGLDEDFRAFSINQCREGVVFRMTVFTSKRLSCRSEFLIVF